MGKVGPVVQIETEADETRVVDVSEFIPGRVRIAVIHDDNSEIAVSLREKAFDGAADIIPRIEIRDRCGYGNVIR
jgi:hypothetical protein